jgi:hypothetical protein
LCKATSGGYNPLLSNTHPDQHAFTFLPGNPSTIYIGNDGGIWKSTNPGTTFSTLNSSLALTMFVGYVLHPTNSAIAYGGTQDNGSQKRLATAGQWREFISGDGSNCVINPTNLSMVFTTYIYGTIFHFTNNGDIFDATIGSNATFGEPSTNPRIAFYPPFTANGVNSTLYFGTWRLFTSTNSGNTWAAPAGTLDLTKGAGDVLSAIAVSRSNTNVIYTGSAQGRAMVSVNGGTAWTDITTDLPNRFITAITVDPGNPAKAYLTVSGFSTSHVFLTTNSGASWTSISGNLPDIPVNTLLIDPLNTNTLYVGTDIGVFQSTTGSVWASFNSGLPPVIVNRLVGQPGGLIQAASYGRGAYELSGNGSLIVTNTSDSGTGSLRQAILDADANPAADAIVFNISGGGPFTITPTSALPTITNPVFIDGTTQPGFIGTPIIELNGTSAGAGASGLTITAAACTVEGLVINRFAASGILLSGAGADRQSDTRQLHRHEYRGHHCACQYRRRHQAAGRVQQHDWRGGGGRRQPHFRQCALRHIHCQWRELQSGERQPDRHQSQRHGGSGQCGRWPHHSGFDQQHGRRHSPGRTQCDIGQSTRRAIDAESACGVQAGALQQKSLAGLPGELKEDIFKRRLRHGRDLAQVGGRAFGNQPSGAHHANAVADALDETHDMR